MTDLIVHENLPANPLILDIGTGSGCIAIALAGKLKNSRVTAIDVSENAIKLASENAAANQVKVEFFRADMLFSPVFAGKFNLIVSNPPYVRYCERHAMPFNVVGHEPESALFVPDNDPLRFYTSIAGICENWLAPGGIVYVEINENFGRETAALFSSSLYSEIKVLQDMQKKDRFVKAIKR
jgi:release factor glutamine methyltransferase